MTKQSKTSGDSSGNSTKRSSHGLATTGQHWITSSDCRWLWDQGLNGFVQWKARGKHEKPSMAARRRMAMGLFTEELNAEFYREKTRNDVLMLDDEIRKHPDNERFVCFLDGVSSDGMLWQAKHVDDNFSKKDIIDRYMPDLQWQMYVTDSIGIWLSVIYGNGGRYNATLIPVDYRVTEKLAKLAVDALTLLDLET